MFPLRISSANYIGLGSRTYMVSRSMLPQLVGQRLLVYGNSIDRHLNPAFGIWRPSIIHNSLPIPHKHHIFLIMAGSFQIGP